MRGAIGRRLPNPNGYNLTSITKQTPFLIQPTSNFSSSSSGGSGRGRGRGAAASDGGFSSGRGQFDFSRAPGSPTEPENPRRDSPEPPPSEGHGHGRGRPIASDPISPAFSSFISSIRPAPASVGRGRGAAGPGPVSPFAAESSPPPPKNQQEEQPLIESLSVEFQKLKEATSSQKSESRLADLPDEILGATGNGNRHPNPANVLGSGAGRGKHAMGAGPAQEQMQEENRHIPRPHQQRRQQQPVQSAKNESQESPQPKLSKEEAVKRAKSALSRGNEDEASGGRGRGGRGRGRGRVGGRGRGRGEGWRDGKNEEEAEAEALSVFVGNKADGEKFAQKVGPEIMNKLTEGFDEICETALPSTAEEAFVDAFETNLMIECEPEYLMADFESNPDIDEKPPMPLRDCLEKVKPFIMSYEGIQSQEEWEEAVNDVMAIAPLIEEIVEHYSGPPRITAKKQIEELERILNTLPQSTPDPYKQFANNALTTLQSNPGWSFDKKCKFMKMLVREVKWLCIDDAKAAKSQKKHMI